jgi:hypothetical protein
VPRIVIKSGEKTADGQEEALTEYLCDWPGCANVAEHVLGGVRELGVFAMVCQEHMEIRRKQSQK